MIRNPILPGFNPDPSICRAGGDFFIATSTFEWYPGVQIHHSRDLAHWSLVRRPLDRAALLDLTGAPDSCGVWAPCLSWHGGLFWLCYTVVHRFDGNFKDARNWLTTAASIDGEWSDPVPLNASGFDPSMFHDEDGRHWLLNMAWDHRPGHNRFGGIVLQEYDAGLRRLTGAPQLIHRGTALGFTEGPHLYRVNGQYHLLTAEGGTGYEHAVSQARSRSLEGPYETDPDGPLLCATGHPGSPLQRTGHGDLVQLEDGRWYLVHLASRPLPGSRRSPLGRETCLQELTLDADGWFRLAGGGRLAATRVAAPGLPVQAPLPPASQDGFDSAQLDLQWQWLRQPGPERFMSLAARPGWLRLAGGESPGSGYDQSLLARRQQHFAYSAQVALDFAPRNFQQMAGLILYYDACRFHYLYVGFDETLGRHLAVMSATGERDLSAEFPGWDGRPALPGAGPVWLRARVDGATLQFDYSADGAYWHTWPVRLDASLLSDEAGKGEHASFTGAFVGLCCQDLSGQRLHADFDDFSYLGRDSDDATG